IISAYNDLARAYYWAAQHAILQEQPPDTALAAGRRAIGRCYALESAQPDCQMQEALLLSIEAAWQGRKHAPAARPLFNRALKLADVTARRFPKDWTYLLPLAEIALQGLGLAALPAQERSDALAAGLWAATTLLEVSPGWPRAMALRAALLWMGR